MLQIIYIVINKSKKVQIKPLEKVIEWEKKLKFKTQAPL